MNSWIADTALATATFDLSLLLKVTLVLIVGLIATHLAVTARASVRHLILGCTFLALFSIPIILGLAPPIAIAVQASSPQTAVDTTAAPAVPVEPIARMAQDGMPTPISPTTTAVISSWPAALRTIWVVGILFSMIPLALGLLQVYRLRRRSTPFGDAQALTTSLALTMGIRRSVHVLASETIHSPMTYGTFKPAILLPIEAKDWNAADLRRALVHELEHIARHDWLVQLASRVICCFYWFHPLSWLALRRLSLEAERACDDAVIQTSEDRTDYAEQLVVLATRLAGRRVPYALEMAGRSDLSWRVATVLDESRRRGRAGWMAHTTILILAGAVALALAPIRAVAKSTQASLTQGQEPETKTKVVVRSRNRVRRAEPLDRALIEAAGDGDAVEMERLLNAGANVNCEVDGDGTPLIVVAREGMLAAMRVLLGRGADPNLGVEGDGNPLIMAAREGHLEAVRLLLDHGAKIDQVVRGDENALIQASGEGHLAVVKFLVERGADVNVRVWVDEHAERANGEWRSPLSMARKERHEAVVAFLVGSGARE